MHTRRPLMLIAGLLLACTGRATAVQEPHRPPTLPHLEHVAVWTADLDKTAAFLNDALGWRRHPLEFGVQEGSAVFGGMKLAFVDANGFWLELVQPTTEGPGMDFLKQKGDGSIVELDFFVDDFDKTVARLKSKGIQPMGMDGKPMVGGGLLREWALVDGNRRDADERLAYLPIDVARGTSIELGWEYPSGVVLYRDKVWTPNLRTPTSTPRTDHVTVATGDLGKSVAMYRHVLDLKQAGAPGLRRAWMGVTEGGQAWMHGNAQVWVNLVAPTGSAGERILKDSRFGDGNIMEIAAEVHDLDTFVAAMKKKGINMTAGDHAALPAGATGVTTPTGDHYAYFPLDISRGMRIIVFQRAKGGHGALAQRDQATLH